MKSMLRKDMPSPRQKRSKCLYPPESTYNEFRFSQVKVHDRGRGAKFAKMTDFNI